MDNYWFNESKISTGFFEPDAEANKEFLERERKKLEEMPPWPPAEARMALYDDPTLRRFAKMIEEKYPNTWTSEDRKLRKKEYRESVDALREDHYERHFRRFMQGYDNGVLNTRNEYYRNGWSSITGFVSKALGPTKYIVNTGKEELALELAQKLSDLFFEYRDKAVEMEGNDE